ncbi:acetyltransferase [Staphylococcus simulans]|uniref:acetyltransferase n=1 Tax=Staphylococcus simulans TaxID=1286 RepID=UPI001E58A632|nr:acetyltransferase [Staphylococcus simulans]MCD8914594.1 acetyltransferase [Staphylococcus simulans]
MNKIFIIGNGGHAKVVKDVINASSKYQIAGHLDDAIKEKHMVDGLIYDSLSNIDEYRNDFLFHIGIGNNLVREKIFEELDIKIEKFPVLIHPSAVIGSSAQIGLGSVVMPNAVINAEAEIGNHVIVNTASVIEHDNKISDYTHVSPNATLTGNVTLGKYSQVGAGATIIPNKRVGKNVIVGAGATVISNIENSCIVAGTPAKLIRSDRDE